MITNPALRASLMLSILIILAGILIIIFIQFDRGSAQSENKTLYQLENKNLIDHIYQTKFNTETVESNSFTPEQGQVTTDIQQKTKPANIQKQIPVNNSAESNVPQALNLNNTQQYPVFSQTLPVEPYNNIRSYDIQSYDDNMSFLKTNPWSPYYEPGY